MSLVVWLPLNGNLENQGLSNITVTNNGATVDNNGKIGKCYKCSGDSRISFPSFNWMTMKPQNNFSFFFWAKGTTNGWLFACSAWEFRLCPGYIQIHLAGNGQYPARYTSTFDTNTWYHLGFTWSGSDGKLLLYLNGSKVAESNVPSSANYDIASTFNLPYDGPRYLNDVRVYDHCLSAKEVGELAKGLVLHYRLAGPGQENFILESHKVTSGGAATGITRSYTSEGYLKVVSTSGNGNWCSVGFAKDSNANVGNKLSVGDTYTMSVEIKVENGTILPSIFINDGNSYKRLQGTIKINQWVQYSYTAVWNAPGTSYGNISLHLGFSSAIGTYYFRNFKLEKGSVATPWCPAPGDVLYDALGYNNNIEYDCSGYRHNGTKSGTITWDVDSPRYTTSYNFSSYTGGIKSNNTITVKDEYTMAIWVKFNTIPSNENTLLGMYNGINEGRTLINKQSSNNFVCVWVGGGNNSSNVQVNSSTQLATNTWYHVVATKDKTNTLRLYFNGKEQGTPVTANYSGGTNYPTVGSINYSSSGYNGNYNLADARIYATALSAEDIAELYHSAVIVDNTGKSYAYEYFEA